MYTVARLGLASMGCKGRCVFATLKCYASLGATMNPARGRCVWKDMRLKALHPHTATNLTVLTLISAGRIDYNKDNLSPEPVDQIEVIED